MDSLHDQTKILEQATNSIQIDNDVQIIKNAMEIVEKTSQARQSHIRDTRKSLQDLARQLQIVKEQIDQTKDKGNGATSHAQRIEGFDQQKVKIEASLDSDTLKIQQLKQEIKDLEKQIENVPERVENDMEIDHIALQLQIYRSLGFEPIYDNKGEIKDIVVHGSGTNSIHTVNIDDGFRNRTDDDSTVVTSKLWELASSS